MALPLEYRSSNLLIINGKRKWLEDSCFYYLELKVSSISCIWTRAPKQISHRPGNALLAKQYCQFLFNKRFHASLLKESFDKQHVGWKGSSRHAGANS